LCRNYINITMQRPEPTIDYTLGRSQVIGLGLTGADVQRRATTRILMWHVNQIVMKENKFDKSTQCLPERSRWLATVTLSWLRRGWLESKSCMISFCLTVPSAATRILCSSNKEAKYSSWLCNIASVYSKLTVPKQPCLRHFLGTTLILRVRIPQVGSSHTIHPS